jgi:TonB family protein
VIQLVVLRDSRNAASAQQVEGSVGLPGAVKPVSALTFATTEGNRRVYLLNLPMSEVEGWGDGGALTLRAGSGLDESLRVSGLRPLLKVMRECVADLGRHWNYAGKDGPPKVRQEPKGSLVSIFSANDYPAEAIRKELQGTVSVVVLIDEAGKVADCTLLETSGVAALDAQTCAIIGRRARYKPAIGLDGKPARSVDVGRIRWVMPD